MARDAAAILPDLFRSLRGQVDRIVVGVDNRTVDTTRDVARAAGAWLFDVDLVRDGVSDYSQGRNQLFAGIPKDIEWVIWIDSDDVLVTKVPLKQVIAEAPKGTESIWLPYIYLRDEYGNVGTEFYRERVLRLDAEPKWIARYHETCRTKSGPAAVHAEGNLDRAKARVWVDHKNRKVTEGGKWDRAYPILMKMIEEDPNDLRAVREVAEAYFAATKWDEAIAWYDRFLEPISEGTPIEERWQAVVYKSKAQRQAGDVKGAVLSAERAMMMCPQYADAYFELEYGYCMFGHWSKAIWWYEQGLRRVAPTGILYTSPLDYDFNPHAFAHTAYWNTGETDKAIATVSKALEMQPRNQSLLHALRAYVHFHNRRVVVDSALQAAKYLLDNNEPLKARAMVEALPAGARAEWSDVLAVQERVDNRLLRLQGDTAFRRVRAAEDPVPFERSARIDWVSERLRANGAHKVLVLGASWGDAAIEWAKSGVQIVGLEIDPRRVQHANFAAVRARLLRKTPAAKHTTVEYHGHHTRTCFDTADPQAWARRRHRRRHPDTESGIEPRPAHPLHLHTVWTRGCVLCGKRVALPKITTRSPVRFEFGDPEAIPGRIRELGPYDAVVADDLLGRVRDPEELLDQIDTLAPVAILTTPDGTAPLPADSGRLRSWSRQEADELFWPRGRLVESHLIAGDVDRIGMEYRHGEDVSMAPPVVIYCGPGLEEWRPDQIDQQGLGGSETAVVYVAKELVRRGYRVMVYGEAEGVWDGVFYRHHSKFIPRAEVALFICWRRVEAFDLDVNAHWRYLWQHDIDLGDAITPERIAKVDGIMCMSMSHVKHMERKYPFILGKTFVMGNGIDPARFSSGHARVPHRYAYVSSPDRGLERALVFWPFVRQAIPDAELHVFYGWENFDRLGGDRRYKAWIQEWASKPGVVWRGRVGQRQLADELAQCSGLFYPGPHQFEETFCIAALEAQAAGCVPVTRDNGALPETNRHGILLSNRLATVKDYIQALQEVALMGEEHRAGMRHWALQQTWERAVDRLLQHVKIVEGTRAAEQVA